AHLNELRLRASRPRLPTSVCLERRLVREVVILDPLLRQREVVQRDFLDSALERIEGWGRRGSRTDADRGCRVPDKRAASGRLLGVGEEGQRCAVPDQN